MQRHGGDLVAEDGPLQRAVVTVPPVAENLGQVLPLDLPRLCPQPGEEGLRQPTLQAGRRYAQGGEQPMMLGDIGCQIQLDLPRSPEVRLCSER